MAHNPNNYHHPPPPPSHLPDLYANPITSYYPGLSYSAPDPSFLSMGGPADARGDWGHIGGSAAGLGGRLGSLDVSAQHQAAAAAQGQSGVWRGTTNGGFGYGNGGSHGHHQSHPSLSPPLLGSSPISSTSAPPSHHSHSHSTTTANHPALPPTAEALLAEKRKRHLQLRTASRSKKTVRPPRKPSESLEETRARESHNHVEQQYRHRLNDQFELLLEALPKEVVSGERGGVEEDGGESGGGGGVGGGEKRVSKAQVLEHAREYIQFLRAENDELRVRVLQGM